MYGKALKILVVSEGCDSWLRIFAAQLLIASSAKASKILVAFMRGISAAHSLLASFTNASSA